ncbi:MAG: hypothetical protein GC182_08865 [Rhodopseudomonas sp.]|nr:hypothetical protein [Rhodopseudomonas sp.]
MPGLIFDIVIGGGGTNAGSNAFGSLGTNGSATTGFGLTAAPPSDVLGPTGAYFTSGNGYGPSPSGGGIGYDNRHAGGAGGAADTNVLGPGVSWGESTYGGGGPSGASSKVAGYTGAIAGVDGAGTGAFDGGPALDGAVNRGGGGGGSRSGYFGGSYQSSSNGGSGVFIVRYRGSPRATGGTITEVNGWTYHTFETSGTFTS